MNTDALITDFYQLTMWQAYFNEGMKDIAVFEFFVRKLPKQRNFLIAAGLEQALQYLENVRFSESDIEFLKTNYGFDEAFLKSLRGFRFTGDVYAMPEGTVFFPDEPILQVVAPISQAQFIESRIINILHFQTLIASKAIRNVLVAPDKLLVDFGMRRAHGAEAALLSARAAYIAGFSGTSTVQAGKKFGVPLYGTMAHSYIQAHDTEDIAFAAFSRAQPQNATLLIDTYDTERGAQKVAQLALKLRDAGVPVNAVRLDSGDLGDHALKVRSILDTAGLRDIRIFASGNLDEYKIKTLIEHDYPIDGFGVGTKLDVSSDAPYMNCAYKLEEYAGIAKRKRSEGKATLPGRKQVYRFYANGKLDHDVISIRGDDIERGEALLQPVMKAGERISPAKTSLDIRGYCARQITKLPDEFKALEKLQREYPVVISQSLNDLVQAVDEAMEVY